LRFSAVPLKILLPKGPSSTTLYPIVTESCSGSVLINPTHTLSDGR